MPRINSAVFLCLLSALSTAATKPRPLSTLPVIAAITVPAGPGWLGVGFGSVWLSKSESDLLLRIDPTTNSIAARIPVGPDPELGIGFGLGSVWIADTKERSLRQIGPTTNKVVRTYPVNISAEPEGSIGVGAGSIWLLTNDNGTNSGTLSRLDPATGKTIATIPVKPKSTTAMVADDAVWVANAADASVQRIDTRTNKVVSEIAVHAGPRFLASGASGIWVWSQGDGSVAHIDPATNRVAAIINVGFPGPGGDLWVEDGIVWISAEGAPINMIDPKSNVLLKQFVGGKRMDTLRAGFGAVWVIEELTGKVWKVSIPTLKQYP